MTEKPLGSPLCCVLFSNKVRRGEKSAFISKNLLTLFIIFVVLFFSFASNLQQEAETANRFQR